MIRSRVYEKGEKSVKFIELIYGLTYVRNKHDRYSRTTDTKKKSCINNET